MTITYSQAVDIGHGRGRLAPAAAASVARIDAQLGRPLDVNSAWRDPATQQELYDDYLRDPKHNPIALPPSMSVHCKGYAIDTDDEAQLALLHDNGWTQTVYRVVNGKRTLVEPWHFEYTAANDRHRFDKPASVNPTPAPATPDPEEDDDMATGKTVHHRNEGSDEWTLGDPLIGHDLKRFTGDANADGVKRVDGKVTVFHGFAVTADAAIGTAWARAYAKGIGGYTSDTDRTGYIAIQVELSRVADLEG